MPDERTQSNTRVSLGPDASHGLATDDDARRIAEHDERPAELLPGTALGRYAVLAELGAGAMGIVYAAYDGKLERKVAIKVVKFDRRDRGEQASGVPRLLREAQALARLSHPNVVPIYDVGTDHERLFLAMELIEGRTLREWLDRRPRHWRETLTLMIQAGRGLAAAHAAQIVHRDFKPDNVLVREAKGGDQALVTDFGLARGLQDESGEHDSNPVDSHDSLSRTLTRTGSVMGTPSYMAPEQHFGRPAEPRSDLYAYCVTLFEALYGVRPFLGAGIEAVARQKWSHTFTDPGSARPAGMPEEIHRLIVRGLDRDPERRFASMDELLGALERVLGSRSRAPWIAAGAVVAIVGGAWLLSSRPPRCPDAHAQLVGIWDTERATQVDAAYAAAGTRTSETMAPRVRARLDQYATQWSATHQQLCERGDAAPTAAAELDAGVACLRERKGELAAVVDVLSAADRSTVHATLELLDSLDPPERCAMPEPAALARNARAAAVADEVAAVRAHVEGVQYARAIELGGPALAHAIEIGDEELACRARLQLGIANARTGGFDAAERAYTDAFWSAREHGFDAIALEAARRMVFFFASEVEEPERAEQWMRHAEAQLARSGAQDTIEQAALLQNSALVYGERGDPLRAEQDLRRALEIRLRLEPADARATSMLRNNLGTLLSAQGRIDEALAMHELTRANRVARLGPVHPDVAMSDINIAHMLTLAERYREALVHIEQARPIIADTLGPFSPMMSTLLSVRGADQLYLGHNDLALFDFQSVLVFRVTRLGPEHSSVGSAWNLLAAALDRPGDGDGALRLFNRALAIQEIVGGSWVAETTMTRMNIGMTLLRMGRVAEAEPIVREGFAQLQRQRPGVHPDIAQATRSLARIEIATGHPARALELLERGRALDRQLGLGDDERPSVAFHRARALWDLGRDRAAAHALVRAARVPIAAACEAPTAELRDIDAWLATHPRPQ